MNILRLSVDGMENPAGYDFENPCFSWVTASEKSNDGQRAYRLEIANDASFQHVCFDSRRVESPRSVHVSAPLALAPCTRYFWRVTVWGIQEDTPAVSETAYFETARYALPWTGRFITGDFDLPQLRRSFQIDAPVRKARLYACGLGLYKAFLNGKPVSDEELTPGFCAYDSWLPYQTYDVTGLMREGCNVLGAWLGNGYYKGRVNWPGMEERRCIYGKENVFLVLLIIETERGEILRIVTDESWESFQAQAKAIGSEHYIELYQNAYDAYLAK